MNQATKKFLISFVATTVLLGSVMLVFILTRGGSKTFEPQQDMKLNNVQKIDFTEEKGE